MYLRKSKFFQKKFDIRINIMIVRLLKGVFYIFNFFNKSCTICKRRIKPLTRYRNDKGELIKVCNACREYAERRVYKKID